MFIMIIFDVKCVKMDWGWNVMVILINIMVVMVLELFMVIFWMLVILFVYIILYFYVFGMFLKVNVEVFCIINYYFLSFYYK